MSRRLVQLAGLTAREGMHAFSPLMFDFYHTAVLCMTVHASLITLQVPAFKYIRIMCHVSTLFIPFIPELSVKLESAF